MKYGDILRYPKSMDPNTDWLFMYIGLNKRHSLDYLDVVILQVPKDDDLWIPGGRLLAGINELELSDEWPILPF
jgi:hypothetical protein